MAKVREKIKLVSTGLTKEGKKTGVFYTTTKNKKGESLTLLSKPLISLCTDEII